MKNLKCIGRRLRIAKEGVPRSGLVRCLLLSCLVMSGVLPFGAEAQSTDTSIVVRTEHNEIHFSARGGVPVHWDLAASGLGESDGVTESAKGDRVSLIDQRAASRASGRPFEVLLSPSPMPEVNDTPYTVRRESDDRFEQITFTSETSSNGLSIVKTYRVPRQGFETTIEILFVNSGEAEIVFDETGRGPGLALGPGLGRAPADAGLLSYAESVFETSDEVTRLYPDDMESITTTGGPIQWAGIHSQYFLMALIPSDASAIAELRTYFDGVGLAEGDTLRFCPRAEIYAQPMRVGPGESGRLTYTLFAGPKDRAILRASDSRLEDVLYSNLWGWMAGICTFFEWFLILVHGVIPNWGLAIIALALLLRVILYPLSKYGHRHQRESQEKMTLVKPLVAELTEKYKDNAIKRHEETIKLHKQYGLNPLSQLKGSIPLLVQLPILVALYHVLGNSFELRGVNFLWIDDLSLTDRLFPLGISLPWLGGYFNLLPVIMFAAQVAMVRHMTAGAQAKSGEKAAGGTSQYMLPAVMLLLFYPFPAGCMLYWTAANISQLLEQRFTGSGSNETKATAMAST